MSNILVTTNQSVIDVTTTSGITVTTPTGQTINVEVPNSSVNVTNTTDEITVVNGGTITLESGVKSVNGDEGPAVVLTTSNINEGTNLYYTSTRANNDFDTRLATKSTSNLAEGTNLYYTSARSNSDFDTRFATKDTDDLVEGSTNKYFSQSLARASLSAGTGISYDNSTGVITNTSINTDTTYTQNFTSTTGGANLNLVGSDSTTDTVKFANGTGVTVSYTDADTTTISIGQSVATTDAVTFGSVNIDSRALLDTATLTTSATTADQVIDTFSSSTYRTAKYIISVTSGTDYQSVEMLVVHNGTTASQTTYADVASNVNLATFSVDISGGLVRLLTTPVNAVTTYKVTKTAIVV